MRKALLYLVVFTYFLSVIKPTMPYLYDIAAHAVFYQHHIATVHKVNGKEHVHLELIKDLKQENKTSDSSGFRKIIPADELLSGTFCYKLLEFVFVKQLFRTETDNLLWPPINRNFPPPKKHVV